MFFEFIFAWIWGFYSLYVCTKDGLRSGIFMQFLIPPIIVVIWSVVFTMLVLINGKL